MSLFRQPAGSPSRRLGLGLRFLLPLLVLLATAAGAAGQEAARDEETKTAAAAMTTFLDEINVTATKNERSLRETPGQVSVVEAEEIEEQGYRDVTDLVRFMPGVYVDGDLTRLGVSGFNIRGMGGNRVATQVDGVPTSEQFDFGPFRVTQYALDLEMLESVEVVRSAGSSLYGSDALGGVVAFRTRHPRNYLGGEPFHLGLRAGYDGRADENAETLSFAWGQDKLAFSLVYGRHDGHELENFGERETQDSSRTAPNPIDRESANGLLKLSYTPSTSSDWLLAFETYEAEAETEVFSSRALNANPSVRDYDALDTQDRTRVSLEGTFMPMGAMADSFLVRGFSQKAESEQITFELRVTPAVTVNRKGSLLFEQDTSGLELEARKSIEGSVAHLLTYGASGRLDDFDQLRDRKDVNAVTGAPVAPSLLYPSKYFPASEVTELGVFLQDEIRLANGKLILLPGVRYDRFELDADQTDPIFFSGNPGTPAPVDMNEIAVSPRLAVVYQALPELSLFVQYAHGFRAPPMLWVNNGFANLAGGYRTLPNPDLGPEQSDNIELGLRGSHRRGAFNVVLFDNQYDDFIELATLPFDPAVGLLEFQPQNLDSVHIKGIELDGRVRLENGIEARAAFAYIEGENTTLDQPLLSVAPPQLVIGLGWRPAASRYRGELIATLAGEKKASDLPAGSTQFRTPANETFDAVFSIDLPAQVSLQLSAYNLTDEKVWRWQNVQGLTATSANLDRYTSAGRNFAAQVRWRF
jgi:hemoglobin/transferrin/lactoferrin receptor protein